MRVSGSNPGLNPPYPGDSGVSWRTIVSGKRILHEILNKETLSDLSFQIIVFVSVKNELKIGTQVTLWGLLLLSKGERSKKGLSNQSEEVGWEGGRGSMVCCSQTHQTSLPKWEWNSEVVQNMGEFKLNFSPPCLEDYFDDGTFSGASGRGREALSIKPL